MKKYSKVEENAYREITMVDRPDVVFPELCDAFQPATDRCGSIVAPAGPTANGNRHQPKGGIRPVFHQHHSGTWRYRQCGATISQPQPQPGGPGADIWRVGIRQRGLSDAALFGSVFLPRRSGPLGGDLHRSDLVGPGRNPDVRGDPGRRGCQRHLTGSGTTKR